MRRKFTLSTLIVDRRIFLPLVCLIGVGFFITVTAIAYRVGFPLDDTWIHLTYARNLANFGEWAFRTGQPSAGSTSPLWTLLLSVGFYLKLGPYFWTFVLGWLILSLISIYGELFASKMLETYRSGIPWVGLLMGVEWHLIWLAVSGMETLLHGLIILMVLCLLINRSRQYLTLGLLAGLSVWVRPDGITLLGPICMTLLFVETDFRSRSNGIVKMLIGFIVLFGLYLLFNLSVSGEPMPSTFYAKQAEYREYWHSIPIFLRLGQYLMQMIAGPLLILLPGLFFWTRKIIRERNWGGLATLLWAVGYIGVYVYSLPAYQHARYILPTLPLFILMGSLGMVDYFSSFSSTNFVRIFWQVTLSVVVILFGWLGAIQTTNDVLFVESQMVETAHWVNQNIPKDAVIAVHDIGAVGYFTENRLVDLAGLVTPEVIPIIRNEEMLKEYLDAHRVSYLITFANWYEILGDSRYRLYEATALPNIPEDKMTVYQWAESLK